MTRAMTGEDGRGLVAQRNAERAELKVQTRRARRLAEALEPLSIRERIRNQWEILDLERRFAEDLDRSVRYALIVFGIVNTGAVLVLTRANVLGGGSGPTVWGVRLFVGLYALLVLNTLRDALQSLRPRLSATPIPSIGMRLVFPHDTPETLLSLSLLPMGANRPSEEDYHRAWQGITGEELSRPLSVASLAPSGPRGPTPVPLRRLSAGAALSLVLTAALAPPGPVASRA